MFKPIIDSNVLTLNVLSLMFENIFLRKFLDPRYFHYISVSFQLSLFVKEQQRLIDFCYLIQILILLTEGGGKGKL
jgi:hypothetical protein